MKKIIIGIALIFMHQTLMPFSIYHLNDYSSQSFMFTRPAFNDIAMQQAQWHAYIYNPTGRAGGSLQAYTFYEKTRENDCDDGNEFAGYFLPDCKRSLIVAGDNALTTTRDVRAEWLGIPSPTFSGKLTIDPKQKQYGAVFEYHQKLSTLMPGSLFENFWISAAMPFVVVKNDINLQQTDVVNSGTVAGEPSNILEAFNQGDWHYAKLNQEHKRSGISELRFKYGVAFSPKKHIEINFYSLLSAPIGGKQKADYTFNPFLGNNGHWAVGSGVNFQIPLTYDDASWSFLIFLNAEHQFLIRNKQFRTFDLKGKPWSRYLLLNSADGLSVNVPAVNVLTRRVTVRPDSFVDFSTGLRVTNDGIEVEVGYDLWAHRTERLKLRKTVCQECKEEVVLSDFGIAGSAPGKSSSASTIATKAADDAVFTPIQSWELDLKSGAGRSALVQRIHAALGIGSLGHSFNGFVNVGGFFEWPNNNAALKRWGFWAKAGASF